MKQKLEAGQIFWLIIPLLNKKQAYLRPFLVYKVDDTEIILLKISSTLKEYIPQIEFIDKPSVLHKKRNFVDSNILVHISHDLFFYKLDETLDLKVQGQQIPLADFQAIIEKVKECFNNDKFRGNRYKVRVE